MRVFYVKLWKMSVLFVKESDGLLSSLEKNSVDNCSKTHSLQFIGWECSVDTIFHKHIYNSTLSRSNHSLLKAQYDHEYDRYGEQQ